MYALRSCVFFVFVPIPRYGMVCSWTHRSGATILGNKFIFQRGFTLPLSLTLVHMCTQSVLAALTIEVFHAVDKVPVSRPDYFRKVLPIAAVFCANIVLGNVSLRFLPVSFMQVRVSGGGGNVWKSLFASLCSSFCESHPRPRRVLWRLGWVLWHFRGHHQQSLRQTPSPAVTNATILAALPRIPWAHSLVPVLWHPQTVKSLTPVATAFLQYMVFRSRLTPQALLTLIPVTGGVAIATISELSFHAGGFIAALTSCFLTGLKFVLSASVLGGSIKLDSINLLLYMAPPAALMLLPVAAIVEGGRLTAWMADPARVPLDYGYIFISGVISFALNVMLFIVLKATSSVTVTVAGNLKTVAVIALSVAIFRNPFTVFNALGCLIAIGGCMWYGLLPKKWATMGTLEETAPSRAPAAVSEVVDHKLVRGDTSSDALLAAATEVGLNRAEPVDGATGMVGGATPTR